MSDLLPNDQERDGAGGYALRMPDERVLGNGTRRSLALRAIARRTLRSQGAVDVKRHIPWFLPARKLSAKLIANRGRLSGTTVPLEITNRVASDFPEIKCRVVVALLRSRRKSKRRRSIDETLQIDHT